MNNITTFLTRWTPQMLGVLRIVVGFLFLLHGSATLIGIPNTGTNYSVEIFSLYGVAGILELVGGIFITVGLFTRFVAFILSGLMASAYFIAHFPKHFLPLLNGGELAALYCFLFLYFVFAGSGAFSIDRLRNK